MPEIVELGNTTYLTAGVYLILGGAMGKSAQVGLHAWLPNAIEAPTPVSALIHAATLITAGVFLVCRLSACFMETEGALYICLVGAFSLIFAGLIGLSQTDFKRVIAFSTMSQVGYIILGCGIGAFQASVFILFTHAFYKALLFLGAGAIIHATSNIQDTRSIGGLGIFVPVTKALFIAASLSLGASPFSSGDFSKDVLIELMSCTQLASKNIF
jgi:NADH-quinone oxidoreductase subunit L